MKKLVQNRALLVAAILLMVISYAPAVTAQPQNDECSNAIAVAAGVPYSGSTVGATGAYSSSCGYDDTLDVWHIFTPAVTGYVLISLCGSQLDTTLAVFDGCGGAELACDDDSCDLQSQVLINMTTGNTYLIRVAGYAGETGNYTLTVTEDIQPPSNDECVNAIEVVEGLPYNGLTTLAGGDSESSCSSNDTLDVWHTFAPDSSGDFSISLCGSVFDTTLAVFDGCGGPELACNDDYCDYQSEVTVSVTEGHTCFIRVAGYEGETGNYTLTVAKQVCELPKEPNYPNPLARAVGVPTDTTLSWNGTGEAAARSEGYVTPTVIYGPDDRLDEYQVSSPALLAAGDATVALVWLSDLTDNGDGTYSLPTETFAQWYEKADPIGTGNPLCPDEPFRNQPNPAWCSGLLVAPDIIATAGHCITGPGDCADVAFIFGFVMLDPTTAVLTIDASELYFCSEIISRQHTDTTDWGLIRLDREVTDHLPLSARKTGKVQDGSEVTLIGHPEGLPRKYAGGATVRDNTPDAYFQTNVDAYGGNSGSAVLDANTLLVEGILVRGNEDFVRDGFCDRSNVCPDTGCPLWEDVTRATEFSGFVPSFDVYFGTDPNHLNIVCSDLVVAACDPGPLECGTIYYWRVIAGNHCGQTEGPLWWFTTAPAGDLDHDCDVDLTDFAALAAHWLTDNCDIGNSWCSGADVTSDKVVDFDDLQPLAAGWLAGK
ncbi:MAG TPA: serine protease [Sedimentisphaerales bacterium]|nr:serine protease [Sedimentisphaerales bacterium]